MNSLFKKLAAMTTPGAAYQICHVLVALTIVLVSARFSGHLWCGAGCMFVFAAVKEGWFDPKYEDATTAGDGWIDFAFYVVGIAAGLTLAHYMP